MPSISEATRTAARQVVSDMVEVLPKVMGVTQVISGNEVIDMDPYSTGATPRYIRVALRGREYIDAWWRGSPTLSVGDEATLIHFTQGNRYEVLYGADGTASGGDASTLDGYDSTDFVLTTSSITAGNGLTGGGVIPHNGPVGVAVGAGDGIDVTADAVAVDVSDFAGHGLGDDGSNNLRIDAAAIGDGLDGGDGVNLSVDVTAIIDTNYGLTESSNDIRINLEVDGGLEFSGGQLRIDVTDIIGSGLTESGDDIDLDWGAPTIGTIEPDDGANAGTSTNPARSDHQHAIAADIAGAILPDDSASEGSATSFARSDHQHSIVTAAPTSDLAVDSINSEGAGNYFARSTHSHAIITSSNPGPNEVILASDAAGRLELEGLGIGASPTGQELRLDGDIVFVGAQSLTNTTGQLTINTADDDLLLSPSGDVLVDSQLATDNWVSGLSGTGWGVSYAGHLDTRSIFAEELRTYSFVAEIYSAMAGALIITQSRAKVSRDFTIPDTGNTATLYVEDLEGTSPFAGTQVFNSGDYVLLRVMNHGTGGEGLVVTNVYGTVSSYTDLAEGEQSWTFTTTTTGYSSSDVIYAGSIVLDYGQTGASSRGVWSATVLDDAGSPYSQVQTWDTITNGEPDNFTTHVRTGNLDGLSGVALEYGLYAGSGLTDTDQYALITDAQAELHNIDLELYDGANIVYKVDHSVPSYALGSSIPTAFDSGVGVWAGNDSGTYKWRVGDPSGRRAQWTSTDFEIYDDDGIVFQVDSDGAWLSNLALSSTLQDQLFNTNSGLLLLNDNCPIDSTSWTSLRGQEATISGAFHQVASAWPGTRALMVEVAGTNEINNPVFANNITDSWTTFDGGAGATFAQDNTHYRYEGNAAKITAGTGNAFLFSNPISLADGDSISAFVYAWAENAGDGRLIIRDVTNATNRLITTGAISGNWERLSGSWTNNTGGAVDVQVQIYNLAGDSSSVVWYDEVQAEKESYNTSFMYGGLSWCSWSGTAHNSTSTRTSTEVNLDDLVGLASGNGTVTYALTAQMPYDYDDTWPTNPTALDINISAGGRLFLRYVGSGNWRVYYNSFSEYMDSALTFSAGDTLQFVVTCDYDSNEFSYYVNGVLEDSGTASVTAPTITEMNLGSAYAANYHANAAISEFALFDSILTAEEISALYQRNAPLVDNGAFDTPGIYILDGQFSLATSTSGARTEIKTSGWWAYRADAEEAFALSLEDSISWGGQTLDQGDVMIGRDSEYMLWDASTAELDIAGGVTAERGTVGGWTLTATELHNTNIWLDADAKQIAINDQTFGNDGIQLEYNGGNPRAYIGNGTDEYLEFDGTNIAWSAAHTVLTAGGDVWFGDSDTTERLEWAAAGLSIYDKDNHAIFRVEPSNARFAFGADVSNEDKTALVIFGADGESYSGETFNEGDLLIGDPDQGNAFWDKSAGQIKFRGGTTVEAYIDTDGSITAGGGSVALDTDGITLDEGNASTNKIKWKQSSDVIFDVWAYETGGVTIASIESDVISGAGSGDYSSIDIEARNGSDVTLMKITSPGTSVAYGDDGFVGFYMEGNLTLSVRGDYIGARKPLRLEVLTSHPGTPSSGFAYLYMYELETGGDTYHTLYLKLEDGDTEVVQSSLIT